MKIIAFIDEPPVVEKILRAMKLWSESAPLAPSRHAPRDAFE